MDNPPYALVVTDLLNFLEAHAAQTPMATPTGQKSVVASAIPSQGIGSFDASNTIIRALQSMNHNQMNEAYIPAVIVPRPALTLARAAITISTIVTALLST